MKLPPELQSPQVVYLKTLQCHFEYVVHDFLCLKLYFLRAEMAEFQYYASLEPKILKELSIGAVTVN